MIQKFADRMKNLFSSHKTEIIIFIAGGFVIGTFFGGIFSNL